MSSGAPPGAAEGADGDRVEVRLLGLPVALWTATREHVDELLREFALVTIGAGQGDEVPARLLGLMDRLGQRYRGFMRSQREAVATAASQGMASVDVTVTVDRGAAQAARELDAALDEADAYCRGGTLLTLAQPPEQARLRHWYLGEIARQVEGAPPTPWTDAPEG